MAKKKIKNLTLEECRKICKKHDCPQCPLEVAICLGRLAWNNELDEIYEREVEVDE